MTITTINDRNYVSISFALKDELKKAIPSAKWDGAKKMWYVGARSKKKLQLWINEVSNRSEKLKEEATSRKLELLEKISKMKIVTGETYHIKDEIKDRFEAIFYEKSWYVDEANFDEAQQFVDSHTKNAITIDDVRKAGHDLYLKMEIIDKALKNFNDEGTEYQHHDDFSEMMRGYHYEADEVFKKLSSINADLFFGSQEADIEEMTHLRFDNKNIEGILKFFGLPEHYCFEVKTNMGSMSIMIINYSDVEETIINRLIQEGRYITLDEEEASKRVDGVGGYKPTFYFKSNITQKTYPMSGFSIDEEKNSSRVTLYSARNIKVLLSDDFETNMNFWWNKSRTKRIEAA